MGKYLKTVFSFFSTYIFIAVLIAVPFIVNYFYNLNPVFLSVAALFNIVIFVIYAINLVAVDDFKRKFNKNEFDDLLDAGYFKKAISGFDGVIQKILMDIYFEVDKIVKEIKIESVNDMIVLSLQNIVKIGRNYSSLQKKIAKNMGTKEQRDQMTETNAKRLETIKSTYNEMKELQGKLILVYESGAKEDSFFLDHISSMNKVLEQELKI